MSYRQTINPKRRLKVEDFIDEWDAAHKSPYGLKGCMLTSAELLQLSGHYKNIMYEAKRRGYIDSESWKNINLTAENLKLKMDMDDKDIRIGQLEMELKLLKRRLDGDVKPNEVMSAIRKERLINEQ